METQRNIKISLATAKEWYKKGGELREVALQAFTLKEIIDLTIARVKEGVQVKYNDFEFIIVDVDFGDTYNWDCATVYAGRLNCSLPNKTILNCIHAFRDAIECYLYDLDLSQTFWSNEVVAADVSKAFSCDMDEDVEDMYYTESKSLCNSIMLIK